MQFDASTDVDQTVFVDLFFQSIGGSPKDVVLLFHTRSEKRTNRRFVLSHPCCNGDIRPTFIFQGLSLSNVSLLYFILGDRADGLKHRNCERMLGCTETSSDLCVAQSLTTKVLN